MIEIKNENTVRMHGQGFEVEKEQKKIKSLKDSKSKHKMNLLEERLQAVKGINFYNSMDTTNLCLVIDVLI